MPLSDRDQDVLLSHVEKELDDDVLGRAGRDGGGLLHRVVEVFDGRDVATPRTATTVLKQQLASVGTVVDEDIVDGLGGHGGLLSTRV